MKRVNNKNLLFGMVILCLMTATIHSADIVSKPMSISSYVDMGQVVSGNIAQLSDTLSFDFITRLGAYVTKELTYNERLDVTVGVGGLFWNQFPHTEGQWWTNMPLFGPGLSNVSGTYKFGDVAEPSADFQMGFFPYKYNPDAMNLGEYLFRSNAYPNILKTGGWSLMNSAGIPVVGARLSFFNFGGALRQDLIFTTEMENYPPQTFSPGYVATLKIGNYLEIGAGACYQHLIAFKSDYVTPNNPLSTIVTFAPNTFPDVPNQVVMTSEGDSIKLQGHALGEEWEIAESDLLSREGTWDMYEARYWDDALTPSSDTIRFADNRNLSDSKNRPLWFDTTSNTYITDTTEVLWLNTATGSLVAESEVAQNGSGNPREDSIWTKTEQRRYVSGNHVLPRSYDYLTFRGLKAMGRISLDIGDLLGMDDAIGAGNFKVFAELGVLGVLDQPYYYTKLSERMPFMMGINVPTWNLLDMLSFQVEYFKSNTPNSLLSYMYVEGVNPLKSGDKVPNAPVPTRESVAAPQGAGVTTVLYSKQWNKDDWKWSLYLKKTLFPGLRLYAQVASDHMRAIDLWVKYSYQPVLTNPKEWYYLFRLEYGI
ncbi:MAG: hypothetical protein HQK83_18250 [Fibrobacteria bacterium]|nr:hypothetical protein [Fibrobacteria bacterium]